MIKAVPFIETIGSDKFKEFMLQPFKISMLCQINNGDEPIFTQWRYKNMGSWYKFTNDDDIVLEFYPDQYDIIVKNNKKTIMSLPQTLDDFVCDMKRYNVQLFWDDLIDLKFEPKDYLNKDEISAYFVNLLAQIDKSNELEL